jgi:hypothetical protein
MIPKLIVGYSTKISPFSRLFQISSVDYKEVVIEVLCSTVLNKSGESLKEMSHGGRFLLEKDEEGELHLSYSNENEAHSKSAVTESTHSFCCCWRFEISCTVTCWMTQYEWKLAYGVNWPA